MYEFRDEGTQLCEHGEEFGEMCLSAEEFQGNYETPSPLEP